MKQMSYYKSDMDLSWRWAPYLEEKEVFFEEKVFWKCEKFENWDPNNAFYYAPAKIADILHTWLRIMWVSERLKNILEANWINQEREDVQFLPIRIFDLETKSIELKWYYLMNILNLLKDWLDKWKNEPKSLHDYILDWTVINNYHIFKLRGHISRIFLSEKIKQALEESDLKLKLFYNKHEVESREEKAFYDMCYKEKWIKVWHLTIWLLYWINDWELNRAYRYSNEPEEMWKLLKYLRDEKDEELWGFINSKFSKEEIERLWIVLRWEEVLRYRWGLRKIEF